jgi:hypothetical protein
MGGAPGSAALRTRRPEVSAMTDVVFITLVLACFAAVLAYARAVPKL